MKITRIAMLILAIAVTLYILLPSLSWASDVLLRMPIGWQQDTTPAQSGIIALQSVGYVPSL